MSHTTEQIRQALADGRAVKRIHLSEEASYWPSMAAVRHHAVVKSWSLGVDALDEQGRNAGCMGEFVLDWYRLGRAPALSLRVKAFSESFTAMQACDGLIDSLFALPEDTSPEMVLDLLMGLGFVDVTARSADRPA